MVGQKARESKKEDQNKFGERMLKKMKATNSCEVMGYIGWLGQISE